MKRGRGGITKRELIIDYSIHFLEQEHLLIAHMRYIGNDYEGDMAQIGKNEATQKWWKVCPFNNSSHFCLSVPILFSTSLLTICDRWLIIDDGWDARELCARCYG